MPLSIYPPTLASTQPAFLYTTTSYPIHFTLQEVTSERDIGHVQVRVVKQTNNRSIIDDSKYPDGTIYKNASAVTNNTISIELSDLKEAWQPGFLYKVQMRFGTTPIWTNLSNFATWKQQQIDAQTFSEWSNVMIIKAISRPEVVIKNAEAKKQDVISQQNIEPTLTPLFLSTYNIGDTSKEAEDLYRFELYQGTEITNEYLLESSGWLQHDSVHNPPDQYRFSYRLIESETYTVTYTIRTVNGYEASADDYTFVCTQVYYPGLEDAILVVDDSSAFSRDNGCMRLYFTNPGESNGIFVITRTDERSDYMVWEDLQYLQFHRAILDNTLIYTDFTIESGIKYKYAIQQENTAGLRTNPRMEEGKNERFVDFDYSYLFADGVQLRLSLNQKISSFKHTVLNSKQDTLGGKYPYIAKNGYAYYAEFPLSGLISIHMDTDNTFIQLDNDGYKYKGEIIVRPPKTPDKQQVRQSNNSTLPAQEYESIGINLTDRNFFIERKFREKVEEFLNNYKYKLYKSPSEGNIVIVLTNISLTPNATLGRMIFDFSATAYEVAENTLENLDSLGIINIGEFNTSEVEDTEVVIGQLDGIYTTSGSSIDLYALIKQQEERYFEGYKLEVQRLKSFWIDRYPQTEMKAELAALEAQRAQAELAGEPTDEFDAEIERIQKIVEAINNNIAGLVTVDVGGHRIRVMPNRIYAVGESVTSVSLIESPYPIVINYIAELIEKEDATVGVISAIETSRIWGQLAGIFTNTEKVLRQYNSEDYKIDTRPYRVYNPVPDNTVEYDALGRVLVDNTKYNAYRSENLYDIIQEETRRQVEVIYKIQDGFHQDEDGNWTDGSINYVFQNLIEFSIEADAGTILWIGTQADGSDKKRVQVGPTQRYTLNPMENMIHYIALDDARPQFCIVDYKCLTSQMTISGGGVLNDRLRL